MEKASARIALIFLCTGFFTCCVGRIPAGPQVKYRSDAVTFNAGYDEVWDATVTAVGEIKWDVKFSDKAKGEIKLQPSFVYNPAFAEYIRVYREPTDKQIEDSNVDPYLREISYYEKVTPAPAPPHPLFARETMTIKVDHVSATTTEVEVKYMIEPFNDYKIGYLGSVPSKGKLEKSIYERIDRIISYEPPPSAPPLPPPPLQVQYRLTDVFFDFDKSDIRPDAIPVLTENAEILKQNPELTVAIQGYADIRGTERYNLGLAQKRADAVRQFLIGHGISPARISALGTGETTRFAEGTTEEAYQLNRRAHFIPALPIVNP